MPLGNKPECSSCKATQSFIWKTTADGQICVECANAAQLNSIKVEEPSGSTTSSKTSSENNGPKIATRKSTRNTRNYKTRLNPYALPRPVAPKGKGRRIIFKKTCTKAPTAVATPVTSNYVFHKGTYIQVGDVVSMRDIEGGLYYAQIRGLLTDQYCEKSAAVTWLIPTENSPDPEEKFDPATYIIGPEEEVPRKLDCMEFICHAPSDYYKARNTPYPPVTPSPNDSRYIWTRIYAK